MKYKVAKGTQHRSPRRRFQSRLGRGRGFAQLGKRARGDSRSTQRKAAENGLCEGGKRIYAGEAGELSTFSTIACGRTHLR
jgi:hypothetical protein